MLHGSHLPNLVKQSSRRRTTRVNIRENRFFLQLLRGSVLSIGLLLVLWITFRVPSSSADAQKNSSSTRTAIAMTAQALLGPFPTSTAPTATVSDTPTVTLTSTLTATLIPTKTSTPFPTGTQRTKEPHQQTTSLAPADTLIPGATNTRAAPSDTPFSPPPTNPPPPTAATPAPVDTLPPLPIPSLPLPLP